MRSFFKIFFASLLALVIFTLLIFFFLMAYVGSVASKDQPQIFAKSVLVLDLGQHYAEQIQKDPLKILKSDNDDVPGLYDVVRLLRNAKTDKNIAGIYLMACNNSNGFASSEEIRNALSDFKQSGKFIIAYGDMISQKAYYIANIADKIYTGPQGFVEWFGLSAEYVFIKGTLDKLEIQPQIFYAGKFKSATEPLRSDRMTPENKLQTSVWLNDLYNDLLVKTSETRKIDTATLHQLANEAKIQNAEDAVNYKLIDGIKYDDEVKDEIKSKLKIDKYEMINFVSINTYLEAGNISRGSGDKIAVIYAEGDIVDGKSDEKVIASDVYRNLLRKARLDRSVKAIVLRVNSGGGSSLASETIWRELSLAKKENKPVIVSFGDVAASGGYYISCGADSIFAHPTTITGSIGVFGIIPNMESFFKNKLGVTFDGVKTGPYADAGAIYRPMNDNEKEMIQGMIDMIYVQFKQRVADGRKLDTAYVDSIAQGRVWTGARAKDIGLVDRFGGLDDAIQCAARMAKLKEYRVTEYPKPKTIFEQLFGEDEPLTFTKKMKETLGEDNYKIFKEVKRIKEITGSAQARMPFEIFIH